MKNISIIAVLALFMFGCSKSNSSNNNTPTNNLTGKKFKLYKVIDSSFNYQPNNAIYYDITHETMTGDTIYLNVGSPTHYIVQPNPIPNYDPNFALADTLIFKTTTTGIDSEFPGASNNITPFTYSLPNKTLTEPPADPSRILIMDDNNFEILVKGTDNGKTQYTRGDYYRKL